MICRCNPPVQCGKKVSQSANNPNREYFTCVNPAANCNFFQWADAPVGGAFKNRYRAKQDFNNSSDGNKIQIFLSIADILFLEQDMLFEKKQSVAESIRAPYDSKLTEYFRSSEFRFNDKLRIWSFDFSRYDEVVSMLKSDMFFDTHQLVELPRFLIRGLNAFRRLFSSVQKLEPDLSTFMMDTLLPFQLQGLKFVIARGGKAMIADEMGCGKTVSAIAVMEHYRRYLPALVLCPPTLLKPWEKALCKFGHGFLNPDEIKVLGRKSSKKGSSKQVVKDQVPKVVVVPYTMLAKLASDGIVSPHQFGIVIADESHNLKEKDSQRTIRALPFLKNATVTLCLTGTPEVNRPVELFTQISGIRPDVFDDYQGFVKRYCDAKEGRYGEQDVKGSSNEAELKRILECFVMIRRLKADVLNDLAEKCREIRKISADPEYIEEYRALDRKYKLVIDKLDRRPGLQPDLEAEKSGLQTQQYLQTGLCKVKAVVEELEKLVLEARNVSDHSHSTDDNGDVVALSPKNIVELDNLSHASRSQSRKLVLDSDSESDVKASTAKVKNRRVKQCDAFTIDGDASSSNDSDVLIDSSDSNSDWKLKKKASRKDRKRKVATCKPQKPSRGKCKKRSITELIDSSDDSDEFLFLDKPLGHTRKRGEEKEIDTSFTSPYEKEEAVKDTWKNIFNSGRKKRVGKLVSGEKKSGSEERTCEKSRQTRGLKHKIVVFAHHKRVMDCLEKSLRSLEVSYCRVDGETPQSRRTQLFDDFQDGDMYDVALLSITACGTGLTLTRANVALFAELAWSCGIISQAEDRIHRIGQMSKNVRIIYMICDETADRYMWPKIQEKFRNIGNTIGMKDSKLGATHDAHGNSFNQSSGPNLPVTTAHQSLMDNYISASQVYGNKSNQPATEATLPAIQHPPTDIHKRDVDINKSSTGTLEKTASKGTDYALVLQQQSDSIHESKLTTAPGYLSSSHDTKKSSLAELPADKIARIEENKRKALLRLQQKRLANESVVNKPPPQNSTSPDVDVSKTPARYQLNGSHFSTGKGGTVNVSASALNKVDSDEKYTADADWKTSGMHNYGKMGLEILAPSSEQFVSSIASQSIVNGAPIYQTASSDTMSTKRPAKKIFRSID